METTIFTKLINKETLFVFEFYGNRTTPYDQGASRKRVGLLTKNGFVEQNYNTPPGAYTRIENLNFEEAMKLSIENTERLSKEWIDKDNQEKKAANEYRANRIAEMSEGSRGWYEVCIKYAVNDFYKGGHKWKYLNGRVIANNPYSAYMEGLSLIEKKNGFWAEEPYQAEINYVGVLTDEYLLENE